MVFTREKNDTSNQNHKRCFSACEKNDTSNWKPQRCASFVPKFLPFIAACVNTVRQHFQWSILYLVIDLIGQLHRDVIGRLSVKAWCYWLWRLVISNWCISIRLLSQLNSRLLLVKLSVLQSFSRSQFCLISSQRNWPIRSITRV